MKIEPRENRTVKIDTIRFDAGTCFVLKGEYYITTDNDAGIGIFAFNLSTNDFLFNNDINWEKDCVELVNLIVVEK